MCEQRDQLIDYLYDEASPTGRREVERHLEGCGECRDELRAFRNVREDLLAWGVPNPPSVWTPFAPAPVVPWHKQVPAWALAAAASLMFVLGSAGGFLATSLTDGDSRGGNGSGSVAAVPAEVTQASLIDSKAILALIREELANADREVTGRATLVSNTAARPFELDPKAEARLMDRVSELVNASHMRQATALSTYLMTVANEDYRKRKEDELTHSVLKAQVDQLTAAVALLQTKGQQ